MINKMIHIKYGEISIIDPQQLLRTEIGILEVSNGCNLF